MKKVMVALISFGLLFQPEAQPVSNEKSIAVVVCFTGDVVLYSILRKAYKKKLKAFEQEEDPERRKELWEKKDRRQTALALLFVLSVIGSGLSTLSILIEKGYIIT